MLANYTDQDGCVTLEQVADGEFARHVRRSEHDNASVSVRIADNRDKVTVTLKPRDEGPD